MRRIIPSRAIGKCAAKAWRKSFAPCAANRCATRSIFHSSRTRAVNCRPRPGGSNSFSPPLQGGENSSFGMQRLHKQESAMTTATELPDTILVVDDEPAVRKTFQEWLEQSGF